VPDALAEDRIRIANEGGIRDAWALPTGTKLAVPGYPPEYADTQTETCVGIGYLIHEDGQTSDFALLKAWSAQEPKRERDLYWRAFARVASAALSQWRFVPRPEVKAPKPVYTVATFVFASSNVLESRMRCAIPDLTQHIVGLKQDKRVRHRMNAGGVFDRLDDIDPTLEALFRNQQYRRDESARRKEPPPSPIPPPPPPPNPPGGG